MNLDNKKPGRKPLYVYYIIAAVIIILLNVLLLPAIEGRKVQTTDYSTFLTGVEKDYVKTVEIQDDYIYYVAESDGQEGYFRTVKMNDPDLVDRLHDANVKFGAAAPQQTSIWISLIAGYVLPIAIFILLGRWLSKKMMSSMGGGPGGAMSFGKSNAKVYVKSSTGIKFSDVAGEDEAKDLLTEIVDYLHNPQKYREIGASMPKGALLVGPPGTGKTLLAKAVAGEAKVPFFSISGSDFVELYVGVGASRVRDLFEQAKKNAPSIIFIDEIDAVGRHRGAGLGGGHDEREQTLNQLLVEMDGFTGKDNVIVIAATNRRDILDPALLRPGRFDRQIVVGYPDVKGREAILRVHTKKRPLAPDVDLATIAKSTVGFTGADLENLVNEASLLAARQNKRAITMQEIQEATIKVIAGPEKKSHKVSEKEKRLTAYHEAGHAVCTYYCDHQDKVHQVSIIPRGMAGGYTMSLPEQDKSFVSKTEMEENIVTLLGGRVAEQLVLDDISTGASNDLERATATARKMVTRYGFSKKLGPIVYGNDQNEVFLGKDLGSSRDYSDRVAGEIDDEVRNIVETAYQKATILLQAHMDQLHLLSKYLILHEKIERDDFEKLMQGKMEASAFEEQPTAPQQPEPSSEEQNLPEQA